jgi:foldase protein PrsA
MLQNKWLKRGLLTLASLLVAASFAAGCSKKEPAGTAAAGTAKDVLVTYKDGGQVTRGDFDTFLNINKFFYPQYAQFAADPAFQQDMMKQFVTFRILAGRADEKQKAEADKKVKEQMDQITMFVGGGKPEEADKKLKEAGVSTKDVEQFIQRSMYSIYALEGKVTDQQVKSNYDAKIAEDKSAFDVATVRHILVGTMDPNTGAESRKKEDALARAKEVKDKLDKGGDFDALAKEYSEDPGSKDQGGKYENVEISQWEPNFKKAAAELPIGKISDPVETAYGYHIMKVESRSSKTFDDVKANIRSEIAEEQVYEFVDKELPGLILTNTLPQPPAAQAPAGGIPTPQVEPAPAK